MLATRAMFSTPAMRALWTDEAVYAAMLRFEAALALAQAKTGVIPAQAADAVARACAATDAYDWQAISEDARTAGTAAIPFSKALKRQVGKSAPEHAAFVHYGATSQDVCETALVLQAQDSLGLIYTQMQALGDALAALAQAHLRTPMLARTLMQPAAPISFGWKAAGWLDALGRCACALRDAGEAMRVVQFGGANGARVALGEHGPAVGLALAQELHLQTTAISWQSARDRIARLGNELALCCAMLGKLGRDISLLMQSEIAEAFEPTAEGRGGSSAMPHKRNPMACMHMLDAAARAPGLALALLSDMNVEHERGLGTWPNALPLVADLFMLLDNSLSMAVETIKGLRVDFVAMQTNLARLHGVIHSERASMLLGKELGAAAAQRIVDEACRLSLKDGVEFAELLQRHPDVTGKVDAAAIAKACGIEPCLDAAEVQCTAVLKEWAAQRCTLLAA